MAAIGFIASGAGLTWALATVAGSAGIVSLCAVRIRFPALREAADDGAPAPEPAVQPSANTRAAV